MIRRYFSILLFLYLAVGTSRANAEDKAMPVDDIGVATAYMRGTSAPQQVDKAFELLVKAFQNGHQDARARLCELRATSYDLGNIILVKKVEVHRYQNGYECDELVKRRPKTLVAGEQARAAAEVARRVAAEKQEQERRAIALTEQKLAAANRDRQERLAAEEARRAAERQAQERLAAEAARRAAEKQEQERLAAARAEEKLERERLAAAIAEEERAIAARAEQERIAAAKAAQELKEKEQRAREAQAAAEAARLAAAKQEQERLAAEAARKAAEKQEQERLAAAKAEKERMATADAARERLAHERAKQVQAAAEAARAAVEKQQERERAVAAVVKTAEKIVADKPGLKQELSQKVETSRSPGGTTHSLLKPGQQVPALSLVSFSGMPVSLDQYRDNVLVLDFFAPWCRTCRGHIPKLAELHSKFRKQGLQVVGLNVDGAVNRQAVTGFADELRMTYLIAQADDGVQARFGVTAVPAIFVVDKKGRIAGIFRDTGTETGRTLESLVKKLLVDE